MHVLVRFWANEGRMIRLRVDIDIDNHFIKGGQQGKTTSLYN